MMEKLLLIVSLVIGLGIAADAQAKRDTIHLADPTIFVEQHTYYLYGTGSPDGFAVYTSGDMKHWKRQDKPALAKGDSYGARDFWAPQVLKYRDKYYMTYAADEHIAIALGDSPLGPFRQQLQHPVSEKGKQIDPFIFIDTDGKCYLYHVRLDRGNRVFVARLKEDLSDIDTATLRECVHAEPGWENTASTGWPVAEGPTVTRIGKMYYLFYSANDFRNPDYAVGYATAPGPFGPWSKYIGNPILSRQQTGQNGSGHGDLLRGQDESLYYVFHTHISAVKTGRRKTALIRLVVSGKGDFSVLPGTFRYLESGN